MMLRRKTIADRKAQHIKICLEQSVETGSTLLDQVVLPHSSAPELNEEEIDLSTKFFGKKIDYPIVLSALTGGCKKALKINKNLAIVAEKLNIVLEVGSQRAGIEGKYPKSYSIVRDCAPNAFVIGNLGASQLNNYGASEINRAIEMIDADAFAFHFNALQESIQPEGDAKFHGILEKCGKLDIKVPLVAKETGCGISGEQAKLFAKYGFKCLDIAGLGGTNFALVESYRGNKTGKSFTEWGIPTALSILECKASGLPIIASGGIRTGIDGAKSIALGADLFGFARPILLPALRNARAVEKLVLNFIDELRIVMFLTDSRNIKDLQKVPKIFKTELRNLVEQKP